MKKDYGALTWRDELSWCRAWCRTARFRWARRIRTARRRRPMTRCVRWTEDNGDALDPIVLDVVRRTERVLPPPATDW